MKSTRRWQQLLLNSLAIILGNALYSLAVALFLEPAGLITGGATGIALAFGRLTGLSVSGFLFLFNMSMLVWGWAVLGKKFALNTLASSVLSPAFLALFERLLDGRVLTEDIFSVPSSRVWASALRWAWSSGRALPQAAWISPRWCCRNGFAGRCPSP